MAFYTHTEVSLRQNMPGACNGETMTGARKWDEQLNEILLHNYSSPSNATFYEHDMVVLGDSGPCVVSLYCDN